MICPKVCGSSNRVLPKGSGIYRSEVPRRVPTRYLEGHQQVELDAAIDGDLLVLPGAVRLAAELGVPHLQAAAGPIQQPSGHVQASMPNLFARAEFTNHMLCRLQDTLNWWCSVHFCPASLVFSRGQQGLCTSSQSICGFRTTALCISSKVCKHR